MGGRQQALEACAQSLDAQNVIAPACVPGHGLKVGCTRPFCALGYGYCCAAC